jgi:hypothetical protein
MTKTAEEWKRLGDVIRSPKSSPEQFNSAVREALLELYIVAKASGLDDEATVLDGLMRDNPTLIKKMAQVVRQRYHCERCGKGIDFSITPPRMALARMRAFAADHAKCKAKR